MCNHNIDALNIDISEDSISKKGAKLCYQSFNIGSAVVRWLKRRTLDCENPDSGRVLPCQILGKFLSRNITPVHPAV